MCKDCNVFQVRFFYLFDFAHYEDYTGTEIMHAVVFDAHDYLGAIPTSRVPFGFYPAYTKNPRLQSERESLYAALCQYLTFLQSYSDDEFDFFIQHFSW